jgi:hypothetical protein
MCLYIIAISPRAVAELREPQVQGTHRLSPAEAKALNEYVKSQTPYVARLISVISGMGALAFGAALNICAAYYWMRARQRRAALCNLAAWAVPGLVLALLFYLDR